MLFDTHAHYDDDWFDEDRDTLLASMPEKGVGLIVNPGITVETSRQAIAMSEQYPHMYAAVGIHPENCQDFHSQKVADQCCGNLDSPPSSDTNPCV